MKFANVVEFLRYYGCYESYTTGTSRSSVMARKQVRDQLRGCWQDDEEFFTRFFPVNVYVHKIWSKAKPSLYVTSSKKSRWLGIPESPKSLGPRVYTALNDLLNNVLTCCMPTYDDPHHPRLFIKTYRRRVLPDLEKPIWPAILLSGAGSCFVNLTTIRPIADYRSAITPLEVVLDSADMELARQRLATVVQEIFDEQPNRRFVFGLVMSTRMVTGYLFDHSGVVCSPPLDYHEHPDQFCALISGLSSTDSTKIGLDNSMFHDQDAQGRICTRDPQRKYAPAIAYYVAGNLYQASSIVGRSTVCFLAHRGDPKTLYVIKDTWISAGDPDLEGRETEHSLLLHAKSKGVARGVTQLIHFEEVRLKGGNGRLFADNIYHIRQLSPSEYSRERQRVHTRIVMSAHGKPLEEFSSRKELLFAYYDAVQTHRNLYETAGILHRDIKPGNILINSGGEEGERGILIDFDHAIRTDNKTPYASQKKIGTYLFMSSGVLDGTTPHDYWDDLESFYYVLVYILMIFQKPHSPCHKLPEFIDEWERPSAASTKRGHFLGREIDYDIQPWFGTPFRKLVEKLHKLWHTCLMNRFLAENTVLTEPINVDHNEFLLHVREAIDELAEEEISQTKIEGSHEAITSPSHSRAERPIMRQDRPTVASLRTLRQNVTYGRHQRY